MGKRAGFRLQPVLELRRMQEKAAAQAAADAAHTAAEADRRATEREDALVGAAQRAMLEHGADAKLVHVAEAAGLTSGAVLYHFPDVQALLLEANRAGMERFYDERVAALAAQAAGEEVDEEVAAAAGDDLGAELVVADGAEESSPPTPGRGRSRAAQRPPLLPLGSPALCPRSARSRSSSSGAIV